MHKFFAPFDVPTYYLPMNINTTSQLKKYLRSASLLLLLGSGINAHAELYKWVDDEGNINYSDQPPFKGAEQHTPSEITEVPAVAVPAKPKTSTQKNTNNRPAETIYSQLSITSPTQDQTIRDNSGNITINLSMSPALNLSQGHSITLLLDSQPVQKNLTGTSATLNNIDRGTHQISAIIKNKQGKIIKQSSTITVHLHRHSALKPKPL